MKHLRGVGLALAGVGLVTGALRAQNAGWSTYRSDSFGYTIAVPPGWRVIEARPRTGLGVVWTGEILVGDEQHRITVLEESRQVMWQGSLEVTVFPNPKQWTAREWVDNVEWGDESPRIAEEPVFIDGRRAVAWVRWQPDSMGHGLAIADGERILRIAYDLSEGNDPDVERHKRTYEQMIGAFRFLAK